MRKLIWLVALLIGAGALWFAAGAAEPVAAAEPDCGMCHNQNLTYEFPDGAVVSIKVDSAQFADSVHGALGCTSCHPAITGYPHAALAADSLAAYAKEQKDACRNCHADAYAGLKNSIHYNLWGANVLCSDCHDTHTMTTAFPDKVPDTVACESCHMKTGNFYLDSIHGTAVTEDAQGVAYCTDCHGAHEFTAAPERAQIIALCSSCHDDPGLMNEYGVSTNVVSSYLRDFHGKTAVIEAKVAGGTIESAVCTDCHGVHNIMAADGADAMINADGTTMCQGCHPGTDAKFAAAWLSHCTPSLTQAPLVFAADWFYRLLIPFIVVGLLIHIGLDLNHLAKRKGGHHHGDNS